MGQISWDEEGVTVEGCLRVKEGYMREEEICVHVCNEKIYVELWMWLLYKDTHIVTILQHFILVHY